jgi:hypothetical protein
MEIKIFFCTAKNRKLLETTSDRQQTLLYGIQTVLEFFQKFAKFLGAFLNVFHNSYKVSIRERISGVLWNYAAP